MRDMLSARGVTLTQGGMVDYYHSKLSSWVEAIIVHYSVIEVDSGSGTNSGAIVLQLRFLGWGSDFEERVQLGQADTGAMMSILPYRAVTQDKVRLLGVCVCILYVCMYCM